MTNISPLHTYGIFGSQSQRHHDQEDQRHRQRGRLKASFMSGARPEAEVRAGTPAAAALGHQGAGVKLECTPMLDGTPLEPVMIGVDIRGNITISDEGEVQVTVRTVMDDLEEHGLRRRAADEGSNCLELTADEQQTLEESALQAELQANREGNGQLEGQGELFEAQADVETDMPFPRATMTRAVPGRRREITLWQQPLALSNWV